MKTLPDSCALIWKYFMALHSTRTSNGFGANPITYTEMKNYFDLIQVDPEEWEIELIRRFDMKALDVYDKANEKNSKQS